MVRRCPAQLPAGRMAAKMLLTSLLLVAAVALFGWTVLLQQQMRNQSKPDVAHRDGASMGNQAHLTRFRREAEAIPAPQPRNSPYFSGGAVFTRWGRTTCPLDSELVYEGVAGGTSLAGTAGGSTYLCVARKPEWGTGADPSAVASPLVGVEFRGQPEKLFRMDNADALLNHDAVCSVCRSELRPSKVMIPGMRTCPSGWHFEYRGYLMSSLQTAKAQHNFICMDEAPEADPKGYPKTANVAELWVVKGYCGPLPCPHYRNAREITCVVCSK